MTTWNGQRAALSLTFDDGLPVQIRYALPELDHRELKGTFFLIQNSTYDGIFRRDTWRSVAAAGHEIGAHSVYHLKPAEVSDSVARADVRECKGFLEREIGVPVTSYAYPYTHVTPTVRDEAQKNYQQARGGRVARENKFITSGDGVDMFNLPCYHVGKNNVGEVAAWIDEAIERGAWLILMFHGVGPDESQWDNVLSEDFAAMLDAIVERQKHGLWVAPLGAVADELRRMQ